MRRQSTNSTETKRGLAQAIRSIDDLLRPAEWDRLDDASRTQLLQQFPMLNARAARAEELLRYGATEDLQEWIAAVVGRYFQPHIVAGVQNWLDVAPETAHLFVGGHPFFGTPQLVASIARQKVGGWPLPSSYCYAPDPDALDQAPILLKLPLGTADAFDKTLTGVVNTIRQQWDDAANRQQVINAQFDGAQGNTSSEGVAYLGHLRTALLNLAAANATFPWDDGDNAAPVGAVSVEPAATGKAPVVDISGPNPNLKKGLLQANGGVLIVSNSISLEELLPLLVTRELSLSDGWPTLPLSVRVVMVGSGDDWNQVPDAIFRYELWSRDLIAWDRNTEAAYAAIAQATAAYYGLPAPSPAAIARLIQEGSRRSDSILRARLLTNMLLIHDLTVEAGKIARARNAATISGELIDERLEQRKAAQRPNVELVQEAMLTGENITPTSGTAVGQINGLGILEVHPWEGIFAIPSRISATVAPGAGEQVLDVERESGQTDDSHDRGLMTMEGYFISQYGQKFPLYLSARIRFEQEQNSMGGDSASAAELFALLSALSDLPIRRSIAVTGAVGQYGEIQPIGGVNFKIEGFWDLCRVRRQRGEAAEGGYGVIIPASNARDLMLRPAVAASIVNDGWFQVWLAGTVDEALPILMGVPAKTVHDRAEQRLRQYAQIQAQFKRGR